MTQTDRFLPDPSWPTVRAAPGDLELACRFCNSLHRENGAGPLTRREV
jgi:hypothetical protein